jgi:hypothetical protein
MKIHDKARLYDELLKDYTELIKEMEQFKSDLENLPNREDLKEAKENNPSAYYAMATGSYSAMAFSLDIKLHKFQGVLKWYTSQK